MSAETILMRRAAAPIESGMASALLPADSHSEALLAKVPLGETVAVKFTRGRSLQQHRLFWGLLDHVAKASSFETGDRLLVALKVRLGRYDLLKMPNGKIVPVPHSISFLAMDQDDFQRFMDESVRLICEEVIPGTNSDDLIREVQLMLGPTSEPIAEITNPPVADRSPGSTVLPPTDSQAPASAPVPQKNARGVGTDWLGWVKAVIAWGETVEDFRIIQRFRTGRAGLLDALRGVNGEWHGDLLRALGDRERILRGGEP
jgi:hypothetical protein